MSLLAPTAVGIRKRYARDWVSGSAGTYLGCSDWLLARSASPTWPLSDQINSGAKAAEYFSAADAAFTDVPFWIYIPLLLSSYEKATVKIANSTGVTCNVTAYLVTGNENPASVGIISASAYTVIGGAAGLAKAVANATELLIAVGATTDNEDANRLVTDWTGGALVIQIDPVGDATTGQLVMTCMRSGG